MGWSGQKWSELKSKAGTPRERLSVTTTSSHLGTASGSWVWVPRGPLGVGEGKEGSWGPRMGCKGTPGRRPLSLGGWGVRLQGRGQGPAASTPRKGQGCGQPIPSPRVGVPVPNLPQNQPRGRGALPMCRVESPGLGLPVARGAPRVVPRPRGARCLGKPGPKPGRTSPARRWTHCGRWGRGGVERRPATPPLHLPSSPPPLPLFVPAPLSPSGAGPLLPRSGPSSATQRPVSMAAARAGAQRRSILALFLPLWYTHPFLPALLLRILSVVSET